MAKTGEIERLTRLLSEKDAEIKRLRNLLKQNNIKDELFPADKEVTKPQLNLREKLSNAEISRYGRQLILPEIGMKGQLSLCCKSVLIIGAGGLGCPAAIYLAAAGIGRIGIVDYDEVELTNLHRQILHTEDRVGMSKAASIAQSCSQLNSHVECIPYHTQLSSANAVDIIKHYDIVLDATDNVATRYLLNDACILTGKPLVSGSALRFEGQMTVYNYNGGPCYRCLYPKPPPPETVTNCSDGGVLGVIPGIIGCIQAMEALKIAMCIKPSFSQRLLMFDSLEGTFRSIKIRGRQPSCPVCGDSPVITKLIDYEQFCGARADDKDKSRKLLSREDRMSVQDYKDLLNSGDSHVLVDVRSAVEMDICKLPGSPINIPINKIDKDGAMLQLEKEVKSLHSSASKPSIVVVCRRGNDSQLAVQKLKDRMSDYNVKDIIGGLHAWAKQIDISFPVY